MALYNLSVADVLLWIYSLTHSLLVS